MKFCSDCFNLKLIKNILENDKTIKGKCEVNPDHTSPYICDTNQESSTLLQVRTILTDFLQFYQPLSKVVVKVNDGRFGTIQDKLEKDFPHLFNLNSPEIYTLLDAIYKADKQIQEDYLSIHALVGIDHTDEFKKEYQIIKEGTWEDFSEEVKYKNRYHSRRVNIEILQACFRSSVFNGFKKGEKFYRARINDNSLSPKDMGSPKEKASSGRLNAQGIGVLYLCKNEEGCLKEVRASAHDDVNIGTFVLKEDIYVVDLTQIVENSIEDNDPGVYYYNKRTLQKIREEVERPTKASQQYFDYIPTQYISDLIKATDINGTQTFDGILYGSTMKDGIKNLALFDETKAECINVRYVNVSEVKYEYDDK